MDEQQAKQLASQNQAIGMINPVQARRRWHEPRELRIEQLAGGFVVATADHGLGNFARQVIPNTDSLLSFVQKWTNEGEAESKPQEP